MRGTASAEAVWILLGDILEYLDIVLTNKNALAEKIYGLDWKDSSFPYPFFFSCFLIWKSYGKKNNYDNTRTKEPTA